MAEQVAIEEGLFNEDKYINSFFENDFKGKFVDLGCFHPTRHNNTFQYLEDAEKA